MASTPPFEKRLCRLHFILFHHTIWISSLRIDFSGARAKVPSSEPPPPPPAHKVGRRVVTHASPNCLAATKAIHLSPCLHPGFSTAEIRITVTVRGTGFAQPSSSDGQSQKWSLLLRRLIILIRAESAMCHNVTTVELSKTINLLDCPSYTPDELTLDQLTVK